MLQTLLLPRYERKTSERIRISLKRELVLLLRMGSSRQFIRKPALEGFVFKPGSKSEVLPAKDCQIWMEMWAGWSPS